jgi:glycosyltransferase involved in cell wall biosynthesis
MLAKFVTNLYLDIKRLFAKHVLRRTYRASICLVVKNEEKNLTVCLDSLLAVINEPWAELVIVDTGSTDRTVEVARAYTDKVYFKQFIPWDFSKARNYGISKSLGKKIMIMDADEELVQQSLYVLKDWLWTPNEEQREKTMFFELHNFYTPDLKEYSTMLQPRVFQRDGKPIYSGEIHNKPRAEPDYFFAGKTEKNPGVVINHYGYLFTNNEKLYKHKTEERALPPLLAGYEKNPRDLHNLTHLCKTYFVMGDCDKCIKYSEEWIVVMREDYTYDEGYFAFLEVLINLVVAYLLINDIEAAERTKKVAEGYSMRLAPIYFHLGTYYANKGNDESKTEEYFALGVEICQTAGSWYEKVVMNNAQAMLPRILNWLASYYLEHGKWNLAGQCVNAGIKSNEQFRLPIRWDVFNDPKVYSHFKQKLELQEV